MHYRGVHLHPYYRDRYRIDPASLPVASDISDRTLSLPLSPDLSELDQLKVADALRTVVESASEFVPDLEMACRAGSGRHVATACLKSR